MLIFDIILAVAICFNMYLTGQIMKSLTAIFKELSADKELEMDMLLKKMKKNNMIN